MFKSVMSALVAQNATETTETEGTAINIPQKVSRCIGVGISIKSAGLTTLESISGVLRLKSDTNGLPNGDQQFPLPQIYSLTSGSPALNPHVQPCDFPVTPGATITPAVIMDMALTINPSWRVQLIFA